MIFLSYTHKDKLIIQEVAKRLAVIFGESKIFYDAWSIQPGDQIIDRMNDGLEESNYFFFFVSKNSLLSEMVKLEWQNALMKKSKDNTFHFIPIKIDDCLLPPILMQTLYINLFGQGLEVAIRQIVDVIHGKNTFQPEEVDFENVRCTFKKENDGVIAEFNAEFYMEPQAKFIALIDNDKEDVEWKVVDQAFLGSDFVTLTLSNGQSVKGIFVGSFKPVTPGFPFRFKIKQKNDIPVRGIGAMRALSEKQFKNIPFYGDN